MTDIRVTVQIRTPLPYPVHRMDDLMRYVRRAAAGLNVDPDDFKMTQEGTDLVIYLNDTL